MSACAIKEETGAWKVRAGESKISRARMIEGPVSASVPGQSIPW
jgi:hypothetical protein